MIADKAERDEVPGPFCVVFQEKAAEPGLSEQLNGNGS